jgi:hypothetical protein
VSRGAAILASLLVTIGRPTWWVLALCGFLVRGGLLVFFIPIVVLPSPLALSNIAAPLIVPVAFGQIGAETVVVVVAVLGALVAWLVIGGWVAAATDVALIREARSAAAEEGLERATSPTERDRKLIGRILAARLIALIPLGFAIAIGLLRIIAITYAELTNPVDVDTPLVARVASGATPQLAFILLAWLLGEIVGGSAARWIVLDSATLDRSLGRALRDVVRRPRSTLLPWLATSLVLFAIVSLDLAAARITWEQAQIALATPTTDATTALIALLVFVGTWLAAFALTGVLTAIRSVVLTFEHARSRLATFEGRASDKAQGQDSAGTFGASAHHRPGDRYRHDDGGSL